MVAGIDHTGFQHFLPLFYDLLLTKKWPPGLSQLLEVLKEMSYLPKKELAKPFVFAVDHCFSIRGQGTVMTGTVLQGSVSLKDVRIILTPALSSLFFFLF